MDSGLESRSWGPGSTLGSLVVGLAMCTGHEGPSEVKVYRAGQDPGIMSAAWKQEPGLLGSPWDRNGPGPGVHSDIGCSGSPVGVVSLRAGLPGFGEGGGCM